ncbi:hypothetical protein SISNIDRAFT_410813 [Sistotremastrum niveocremeum HHB9708]|uniref:Uncharacterized protein n=1 Tax=Sistotremastrum niveocremeum HHB9708 TaxID=1314777 RepID=A0A164V6F3_9AGAM|nr:hypothetical protein SISNIDRAFT_410813 [Sistotremastrum niveocremeum HHB9708]
MRRFRYFGSFQGILYKGCSNTAAAISDCYNLTLTSNPNEQLDPNFLSSPRQRIELRGDSHPSGSSYSFQWKQWLSSSVGTSTHFFHLMQVFDETADGPVVTLDAVSNKLSIKDYATARTDCGGTCPSVALTNYNGITTLHSMTVTFGQSGSLSYKVTNAKSGATVISYSAAGAMGGDSAYLKFGTYRATFTGMTASE